MNKLFLVVAVLFAVACVPRLSAQDYDYAPYRSGKIYVSGSYGTFFDFATDSNPITTGGHYEYEFDGDDFFTGAIGYHTSGLRTEMEFGLKEAGLMQINPTAPGFDDSGEIEYMTLMANIYYDQPVIPNRLDFYLGGGVGASRVTADFQYNPSFTFDNGGTPLVVTELDDEQWVVAGQLMAGLAYHVTENISVTGGYRLRIIDEVQFDNNQFLDTAFIHGVEVGLRIAF